jgi:hypothetical protein
VSIDRENGKDISWSYTRSGIDLGKTVFGWSITSTTSLGERARHDGEIHVADVFA